MPGRWRRIVPREPGERRRGSPGSFGGLLAGEAEVDVGGPVQPDAAVPMIVVVPGDERVEEVPSVMNRAEPLGESGPVFDHLEHRLGARVVVGHVRRECERVTSRSASSAATVLLVIDVPRSACTTSGMPRTAKMSVIISAANSPHDSRVCTVAIKHSSSKP